MEVQGKTRHHITEIKAVLMCMFLVAVLFSGIHLCSFKTMAAAVTYTSDDGNWKCTIDSSEETCAIKPAKSGVSGVSKGTVKIPAKVTVKSKKYNVTNIANSAYKDNTAVTKLYLNDAIYLKTIRAYAFKGCTSLETITGITNTALTSINDNAFEGAKKLIGASASSGLVLPDTLTNIGDKAFYACSSIKLVNGKKASAIKKVGTYAFKGINSSAIIYAYDGAKYKLFNASTVTGTLISYNYTVTYERNGGSGTAVTQKCVYGSTYNFKAANTYTKTGYTLSNWNLKADATGKIYACGGTFSNLTKTGYITVYAHWIANKYTLKFNANGGKGAMSNMAMTYDKVATLNGLGFSREGYIFGGWALSATGKVVYMNKASVKNLTAVNGGTVTLYAVWKPIAYKVSYNPNGGTLIPGKTALSTVTYNYDTNIKIAENVYEKPGYIFAGWRYDNKTYNAGDTVKNLSSVNGSTVTLTAVWEAIRYTFVFDGNAPSGCEVNGTQGNITCIYDVNKSLGLCKYSCIGYKFKEWNTLSDGSGVSYKENQTVLNVTTTNKETITLYAIWDPIHYTIKFNKGKNGGGTVPADIECIYGKPIEIPEYDSSALYKKGWVFLDWCLDYSGKENEDGSNIFAAGEKYNTNLTTDDGAVINLYGRWVKIKYTMNFVTGTKEQVESKKFNYSSTKVNIPEANATYKPGYSFTSWNTRADGKGETISGDTFCPTSEYSILEAGVPDGNDTSRNIINLYAQWKPNTYTVYLDAQGASNVTESVQVTFGSKYSVLPTPTRTGYIFKGWSLNEEGTKYINRTDTVNQTDNISLYAIWQPKTYKVTYKLQKGTWKSYKGSFDKTYNYDSEITDKFSGNLLPVPKRKGYNFKYWYYKTKDSSGKVVEKKLAENSEKKIIGNLKVYAKWEKQVLKLKKTEIATKKNSYQAKIKWTTNYPQISKYKVKVAYSAKDLKSAKVNTVKGAPPVTIKNLKKGKRLYMQIGVVYKKSGKTVTKWYTVYDIADKKTTVVLDAKGGKIGNKKTVTVKPIKGFNLKTAFADGKIYTPVRKGYTFKYWYYKKNGKNCKVTDKTIFKKKTTLYAKWKKKN